MSMELVKVEQTPEQQQITIPDVLPVLPLPDVVMFPYMIAPLFVNRERSAKAVDQALAENRMILLVAQKNPNVDDPKAEDLHDFGTVAIIMRMLKLPDGRVRILVQGFSRAKVESFDESKAYITAKVQPKTETQVTPITPEIEALIRNVKSSLEKMVSLGKNISTDLVAIASNLDDAGRLADLVASNLDLKVDKAQEVLEAIDPIERLRRVNQLMAKETEVLEIQNDINTQARGEMDKSQREFYLRQQMKAIQQELGEGNELQEEIEQYRHKIKKAKMPKDVAEEAERQVSRLERMHPDAAETATLRNYLDWMVSLPWSKATKDNLDLKKAQKILDEDHYGLEKIKDRIIEYLAVRKLKKDSKGPILCFVRPPGVGKTSLGKSIARALGRKFVRMSLGGVHDEAEIRGHRRTYVGALPGRIIQAMKTVGVRNPVFLLDEIDKLASDYRGDPAAALLEVLDPEQNNTFTDHYLEVPYDLSEVFFICTGNNRYQIPRALADRMDIVQIPGYTEEEKIAIGRHYVLPKVLGEHGLSRSQVQVPESAMRFVVSHYTREAGVRGLERQLATICRKAALRIVTKPDARIRLSEKNAEQYLGVPRFMPDRTQDLGQIGVATGLAWTENGGTLLPVEVVTMTGKGHLMVTGQLGDVMQESARAALSYIRSRADELRIPASFSETMDIHIHLPEGAIPKDGPSGGITMAAAVISALTRRAVRSDLAMTGEITLRGRVLAIGGLKEKALAAHRAGIRTLIIPRENSKDLVEIPAKVREEMTFHLVDSMDQVVELALLPNPEPDGHSTDSTDSK